MVNHAETQQRLFTALGTQLAQAQVTQAQANQRNTDQVLVVIGAQSQAQQGHINTMNQVGQSLRGSVSSLEQAVAAMAGHTAGIGPQITTAMGQMSGQIGQAVSSAMASQPPLAPPAAPPTSIAPVTPPADQLTTLATALGGAMGQGARELSRMLHNNLHDFFVQAAQQNAAVARANVHLQEILTALRSQPGMQVFQYFDQRQHHVLTQIQNIMNYAPQFQQQINVDRRVQIGRMMLQNVVNVLYNQQIPRTPQNVNGAVMAITNGQLALQDLGGETAIPLPDAVRTEMPADPLSATSIPIPSPTVTGVEADVPTETTVRDGRPGNR